jgi:transcription factor 1
MMTLTPKKEPLIKAGELEAFEFITRNLFILRSKTVGEALTHVAPGGQNILKMTGREQVMKGMITQEQIVESDMIVNDLTNMQWANLARTFEKWPFRPEHLFEEGRVKVTHKDQL